MNSIWGNIKRAVFVVHYSSLEDVKKIRQGIKAVGLNINDCEIIAVFKSKKEKESFSNISSVTPVSEKDITLLGKLKNENMLKVGKRHFDALFFVGDFSKRVVKMTSSIKPAIKVGINSEMTNCSVYLNTSRTSATHLINFAKQTLEKTI